VDGGLEAAMGDAASAEHGLGGAGRVDEAGHLLGGRRCLFAGEDGDVPRALALDGAARITIVNRNEERGRTLEARLKEVTNTATEFVPWTGTYVPGPATDLLVNSTSIGLYPDVDAHVPVSLEPLGPDAIVCDVIPNPPKTRLIRDAQAKGLRTLDGLGMLVNQGVIGIELWTGGKSPDPAVMRAALEAIFGA